MSRTPAFTRLWLIRHAEVETPYQGVFGGTIDMNLSDRGRQQAVALANSLHRNRFDGLYASPMRRVQQTLAPLLTNGLPPPQILPELREVDFGVWTGLSWEQIETQFGVSVHGWLDQLERGVIPKAESVGALRARLEPCLRRILATHSGGQVAVFCHGGVIRMFLAMLLGWPLSRMSAFEIEYASVSQVRSSPTKTRLELLNFTPWRDLPP